MTGVVTNNLQQERKGPICLGRRAVRLESNGTDKTGIEDRTNGIMRPEEPRSCEPAAYPKLNTSGVFGTKIHPLLVPEGFI